MAGSSLTKQRKNSTSSLRGRPGRTSKGYGGSVCWKGVPEAEELWNTASVNSEGRAFAGYARTGVDERVLRMLQ